MDRTDAPFDAWSLREAAEALLLVTAALETGLLDGLDREREPAELAATQGLDPRAAGVCLEALVAVGVLERRGAGYRLTDFGRGRFIERASPRYVGGELASWRAGLRGWLFLDEVLRSGATLSEDETPAHRARLLGILDAKPPGRVASVVESVLRRSGVSRPRILDVGGGSGAYARGFLARGCTVTLLETPEVLRAAASAFGLARLPALTLLEGDFLSTLPEGAWDVVLLADVLHDLPATSARELVLRVGSAAAEGCVAAVLDLFRDRSGRAALYAVSLLLYGEGDAHPGAAVADWLEGAGFGDPMFRDLDAGRSLLTARRTSSSRGSD